MRIGPVGIGPDKQPAIAQVTETRTVRRPRLRGERRVASARRTCPWRIEVTVAPTFVPAEVDPSKSDRRGARRASSTASGFQPLFEPLARRGDEVREADAEREARERARALERLRSAASAGRAARRSAGRRTAAARPRRSPAARRSASTSSTRYCRGLRSKTSFFSVYPAHVREERGAVARVVDRAKDGRRRDRLRRRVVVEVAELDRRARSRAGARPPSTISGVESTPRYRSPRASSALPEAAVAAGEVEHLVARRRGAARARRSARRGARGTPSTSAYCALRPVRRLARVLRRLVRHSASRRSGCLRTNRAIPRACQSVWRERNRRSMTAAYVVGDDGVGHVPPLPPRLHRAVAEVDVLAVVAVARRPSRRSRRASSARMSRNAPSSQSASTGSVGPLVEA